MDFNPYELYHVYNQGNNKQDIFIENLDYHIFLNAVRRLVLPHADLLCYCLMPNHFHMMLHATERSCVKSLQGTIEINALTNSFRILQSSYAQTFNKRYQKTGSLFRQKAKNKLLTENLIKDSAYDFHIDYPSGCFSYIHNNPVKSGLAKNCGDWPYSSFNDHLNNDRANICNIKLAQEKGLFV